MNADAASDRLIHSSTRFIFQRRMFLGWRIQHPAQDFILADLIF
jgi:hypothetical protein